jgi:hypothetical protein
MEYRAFEEILGKLHRVAPDDSKAFRARLRILRDLGIPNVAKPGKGARVDYRFDDLWAAHLGLTFDDAGLPPLVIKEIMAAVSEFQIYRKFLDRSKEEHDLWLKVDILRHEFGGDRHSVSVWPAPLQEQMGFLRAQEGHNPAREAGFIGSIVHSLINLSGIYEDCLSVSRGL